MNAEQVPAGEGSAGRGPGEGQRMRRGMRMAMAITAGVAVAFITLWSVRWFFTTQVLAGHFPEFHALRAMLVADRWQAGELIPRWVPELAGGLGYPLFIYYAWLSYAFAAELHVLGLAPVAATNAVIVAAALFQTLGVWRLGREVGGRAGGWVAWALFAFAPYQLLNLYVRGNFPEFVAGSFAPWALWAMLRWVAGKGRGTLPICAALLATILLCHNITGLTVGGTVTAIGLLFAWTLPSGSRAPGVKRALVAALAAVALSAFFWLPIAVGRQHVQLANDFKAYLDYRQHFLYWHQLVATGWGYGYSLPGPKDTMPLQLGIAQVASLLLLPPLAIAITRRGCGRRRMRLAGLTLLAALLTFLTTYSSAPLWSVVTPLATLQFPWRLHLPGTLVIATAAALAVRILLAWWGRRRLALGLAVITCLALALATLSLRHAKPLTSYVCDETCLRRFLGRGYFTTSIQDEFRPVWAEDLRALGEIMLGGRVTLDDVPLPEVRLPVHQQRGNFVVRVDAERSGELRLPMFWFPGWQVTADGVVLPTYPCQGTGIVCSRIAAGSHILKVAWQPSFIYWLGSGMSLATLIALVAYLKTRRGKKTAAKARQYLKALLVAWSGRRKRRRSEQRRVTR